MKWLKRHSGCLGQEPIPKKPGRAAILGTIHGGPGCVLQRPGCDSGLAVLDCSSGLLSREASASLHVHVGLRTSGHVSGSSKNSPAFMWAFHAHSTRRGPSGATSHWL